MPPTYSTEFQREVNHYDDVHGKPSEYLCQGPKPDYKRLDEAAPEDYARGAQTRLGRQNVTK